MQHELAALENSIIHLLQTNAEIREEHDTEDPDLKLALEENTTVCCPRAKIYERTNAFLFISASDI